MGGLRGIWFLGSNIGGPSCISGFIGRANALLLYFRSLRHARQHRRCVRRAYRAEAEKEVVSFSFSVRGPARG